MDNDTAVKRLRTLVKEPGALKVITHFHACSPDQLLIDGQMAAASKAVRDNCAAYAKEHGHRLGMAGGYRDVGHYILVDVQRIEKLDDSQSGRWIAYGDDELGSSTAGEPADLLRRLTEHEQE